MADQLRPPPAPLLVVAAALIAADGAVLVQRRPAQKQHGGLWEFPGGKVEPGETPERALVRELAEELGIAVDAADVRPLAFATRAVGDGVLVLLLYRVDRWKGQPRPIEAAALAWRSPDTLADLPMPPAARDLLAPLRREWGAADGTDRQASLL